MKLDKMLIRFDVGNYLSFDEIQRFSMVAGPHDDKPKHIQSFDDLDLLRGSFIYGSNASGKSNFVRAFIYSREIILGMEKGNSTLQKRRTLSHRNSDESYSDSPCYFEYSIAVGDQFFSYGLEVDSVTDRIVGEWLFGVEDGTEDLIFTIDWSPDGIRKIAFPSLEQAFEDYIRNGPIKSFLSYANLLNNADCLEIKSVYRWFEQSLVVLSSEERVFSMVINDSFMERLVFYLRRLDTGIVGFTRRRVTNVCKKNEFTDGHKTRGIETYVMFNEESSADGSMKVRVQIPYDGSEFDPVTIEALMAVARKER